MIVQFANSLWKFWLLGFPCGLTSCQKRFSSLSTLLGSNLLFNYENIFLVMTRIYLDPCKVGLDILLCSTYVTMLIIPIDKYNEGMWIQNHNPDQCDIDQNGYPQNYPYCQIFLIHLSFWSLIIILINIIYLTIVCEFLQVMRRLGNIYEEEAILFGVKGDS